VRRAWAGILAVSMAASACARGEARIEPGDVVSVQGRNRRCLELRATVATLAVPASGPVQFRGIPVEVRGRTAQELRPTLERILRSEPSSPFLSDVDVEIWKGWPSSWNGKSRTSAVRSQRSWESCFPSIPSVQSGPVGPVGASCFQGMETGGYRESSRRCESGSTLNESLRHCSARPVEISLRESRCPESHSGWVVLAPVSDEPSTVLILNRALRQLPSSRCWPEVARFSPPPDGFEVELYCRPSASANIG
jgi:hypothetical protein